MSKRPDSHNEGDASSKPFTSNMPKVDDGNKAELPTVRTHLIGYTQSVHIAVVTSLNESSLLPLLHPDEVAVAASMGAIRRESYIAGRVALRAAVSQVDNRFAEQPLLHNDRGAPTVPHGVIGSLSHKANHAIAVATTIGDDANSFATIGIDIETINEARTSRIDIARRILTTSELDSLSSNKEERLKEVLLYFSLKEAIYKAIDPYVHRYVRFKEVSLAINNPIDSNRGSATAQLLLSEFQGLRPAPDILVDWWQEGAHIISVAATLGSLNARSLRSNSSGR